MFFSLSLSLSHCFLTTLEQGLEGFEGVVYLDESDQKVILVRQTERVMTLQDCGIPLERRFAFYDQAFFQHKIQYFAF